jgi:predicted nuclease of predicted toxin-antitoxin system
MRLLLDECVPARLKRALSGHDVSTVVLQGWAGIKNGELLALAAASFDAFVTVDKNLPYQQNTAGLPLAVLVLDSVSNELSALLPLMPSLEQALSALQPCTCVLVRADV